MADLQPKFNQVRLLEKLGNQGFQYDTEGLFEPITKAATDTSQKLVEGFESTTEAIEELHESYVLVQVIALMNESGVNDSSFNWPIAKFSIPTNKSHFRLYRDPERYNWNVFIMNGEKFTLYGDKLDFEKSGSFFTYKSDVLKTINDYKFNQQIHRMQNWLSI